MTVQAGGQAIVGAVATRGGGVAHWKSEEQPHALTHAPEHPDAEPGPAAGARAARRRCLTAAAGCTGALSRSFAVLLEALNRHRGKGQQKVTVEHVHCQRQAARPSSALLPPGGRGGEQA